MANPKYKTSRSKTRRRRANINLEVPNLVECPHCHQMKLAHRACLSCGYYKGREVIKFESEKAKAKA